MKIGVLGDTHIPTHSPLLPARVAEVFAGLDLILHVGDVCELDVLENIQETYALTFAVWGESDSREVHHYLEEQRVVRFGGRSIGMIHGHQADVEASSGAIGLRRLFQRQAAPLDRISFLLDRFAGENVDVIVTGHTHEPYVETHSDVLLLNPGAALPGPGRQPSVGILDVQEQTLSGRIVAL